MDRPMIVGGEPDYDKLLSVGGADTVPPPHAGYSVVPYSPSPAGQHALAHAHHPHQHPGHHGYNGHHPQHAPPAYPAYVVHHAPPPPPPAVHHYAPPAHAPHPQQHAAPPHPAGRHVVQEAFTKSRDFPIGFTAFGIPPGPPVEIEVKPQVLFKGKRLAVADSIAKDFVIVDIKVGTSAQLAATGEMSAEAFSALAVDTKMEFDTAAPGTTITIRVRNIAEGPSNFLAVLYGAVLA